MCKRCFSVILCGLLIGCVSHSEDPVESGDVADTREVPDASTDDADEGAEVGLPEDTGDTGDPDIAASDTADQATDPNDTDEDAGADADAAQDLDAGLPEMIDVTLEHC